MPTGDDVPSADGVDAAEQQIAEQSKRIEFFITEYSVEILADKMRAGEYVVPSISVSSPGSLSGGRNSWSL